MKKKPQRIKYMPAADLRKISDDRLAAIASRVNKRTSHGRGFPLTGEDILRMIREPGGESHPVKAAVMAEWRKAFPTK